jgi:hypothetical protein
MRARALLGFRVRKRQLATAAERGNPDRAIATFQTLLGAGSVIYRTALAASAGFTTASAELKWINGWSAAAVLSPRLYSAISLFFLA